MKIERHEMILNLRETPREKNGTWTGVYSHVAGDKIYYRLDNPSAICYAKKKNDTFIKPNNNTVLINSLAIENFRVFVDTKPDIPEDEKYKAIGGYHTGKNHGLLKNCETSKAAKLFNVPSPCWPLEERLVFGDDFYHPYHANGYYIFKSPDGVRWSLYHDKPVLSNLTRCDTGILGSDNMPSIFYDKKIKEYITYLRSNEALGVRHVFYSRSKDLINWSTPKLITKNPEFDFKNENLYFMGAYPLSNNKGYIAFSHFFRNEILTPNGSHRKYFDKKTLVMKSQDGIHWEEVGSIFSQDAQSVKESRESGCVSSMATHMGPPHVVSFEEESDRYILYVLEGIQTPLTRLVKYTIDKEEIK
jgi:hypothetical protein